MSLRFTGINIFVLNFSLACASIGDRMEITRTSKLPRSNGMKLDTVQTIVTSRLICADKRVNDDYFNDTVHQQRGRLPFRGEIFTAP